MTKREYINEILTNFSEIAEEVPSESAQGTYVKKISFTKGQLAALLFIVLNDEHVTWNTLEKPESTEKEMSGVSTQ